MPSGLPALLSFRSNWIFAKEWLAGFVVAKGGSCGGANHLFRGYYT
jgi:hypothetical protein